MICKETKAHKAFAIPNARILVVDDNKMNLKLFRRLLKDSQAQVEEAESGEACLDLTKRTKYDIIFMDHMMPEMDGVETLHRLRQLSDTMCQNVPVIALTANAANDAKGFYLAEGFDGFLGKPFMPKDLEQIILQHLPQEYIIYESSDVSEDNLENAKEAFPKIGGIDWNCALKHFDSKEAMFDTMTEVYRTMHYESEKLHGLYNILVETRENKEEAFKQYRVQMHSMKGTANLIGVTELGALAKKLEDAASEYDSDIIFQDTMHFLEEWNACRERLQKVFHKDESKSLLDVKVVLELLEKLKHALIKMNVDQMDMLMKGINGFTFPMDMERDIEKINVLVTDLDEEEGIPLIDELIEKLMK